MRRLFADTHFYIALLNRRDADHQAACEFYETQDISQIITTAWVLAELADGMAGGHSREVCANFIDFLRQDEETVIIEATADIFWRGFELYRQRPDKEWSLTDCISFVVMTGEGVMEALTGDRHFEQAGFGALLAD